MKKLAFGMWEILIVLAIISAGMYFYNPAFEVVDEETGYNQIDIMNEQIENMDQKNAHRYKQLEDFNKNN